MNECAHKWKEDTKLSDATGSTLRNPSPEDDDLLSPNSKCYDCKGIPLAQQPCISSLPGCKLGECLLRLVACRGHTTEIQVPF